MATYPQISAFSLKNQGGFACRARIDWYDGAGNEHHTKYSNDFDLGRTTTLDPGKLGVTPGATMQLYVDVRGGKNNKASQLFIYQPGNGMTAEYAISGTTLDNRLGLTGISGSSSAADAA